MSKKRRIFIASALVGTLGASLSVADAYGVKGKCYSVVEAGQNNCSSKTRAHACAGQSKKDYDPLDFKLLPKSTCDQLGGEQA
ncbi:DUF2282 domain-containing protein [bacterium]|nr:MAG: DUF2282 domain-containing protein [bacterium]